MKIRRWMPGLLAITLVVGALGQSSNVSKTSDNALVARGKYLVERTGMCADCHTPMNQKGEPIKERHLGGAPLMFKPTVPVPGWVEVAPPIAGLPGFTDAQAIKFLTTGIATDGKPAGPPMPSFRFNKQDATAIVAYLRSLKPSEAASGTPAKTTKPGKKSAE